MPSFVSASLIFALPLILLLVFFGIDMKLFRLQLNKYDQPIEELREAVQQLPPGSEEWREGYKQLLELHDISMEHIDAVPATPGAAIVSYVRAKIKKEEWP